MTCWKVRDSIQQNRGDGHSCELELDVVEVRDCFQVLIETESILQYHTFPLRHLSFLPLFLCFIFIYLSVCLWRQWVSHFEAHIGFKLKEILLFLATQFGLQK